MSSSNTNCRPDAAEFAHPVTRDAEALNEAQLSSEQVPAQATGHTDRDTGRHTRRRTRHGRCNVHSKHSTIE